MKPQPRRKPLPPLPEGARNLMVHARQGSSLGRQADGAVALGYFRGFQAGYEQAMRDSKAGCLDKENAFRPNRAEQHK